MASGARPKMVPAIVNVLEQEDVLTRTREGQRNRHKINRSYRLRHPLESSARSATCCI